MKQETGAFQVESNCDSQVVCTALVGEGAGAVTAHAIVPVKSRQEIELTQVATDGTKTTFSVVCTNEQDQVEFFQVGDFEGDV